MMRLRVLIAFSSMVFIELKMKLDESKSARRNIRLSWFSSSSKAPIPSESITNTFRGEPSALVVVRVRGQTQSPFVHGLMVGPTPKPPIF